MPENIKIRKAQKSDAEICADLRYLTEPEICDFLFDSKENFKKVFRVYFDFPGVIYTSEYTWVYELDGKVVASITMYPGEVDKILIDSSTKRALSLIKPCGIKPLVKAYLRSRKLIFNIVEAEIESYFVCQLAVLPEYRRRGIASELMDFAVAVAGKSSFDNISLKVMDKNEPAIRLYQNLGFTKREEVKLSGLERFGLNGYFTMRKQF